MTNDINPFDLIILTAAHEQQAEGFRAQLDWRREYRLLPEETTFWVIADPGGRRIGSGGSTLYVLDRLQQERGEAFKDQRVLILHSGGDSRRLPAYSPLGKVFTPLPGREGQSLFDIMIRSYATLPAQAGGQVIVTSGDVLLNFDARHIHFAETGLTGVAYPDDPAAAAGYGVYGVNTPIAAGTVHRVDTFLQKPDRDTLERTGVIDFGNRVWVDTGILYMARDAVERMLRCTRLIESFRQGRMSANLYHEILFTVMNTYDLPDGEILSSIPFSVSLLPYCGFFHLGRTREMIQNLYTVTHAGAEHGFCNGERSNADLFPELKTGFIYNSVIRSSRLAVQPPVCVEGCALDSEVHLEGENLLTGLPPGMSTPIDLSRGLCLAVFPVAESDWTAVLYGIDDSFKSESTFCNTTWSDFVAAVGVDTDRLWDTADEQDLWSARLFPVGPDPDAVVAEALRLSDPESLSFGNETRLSMKDILLHVHQRRLLDTSAESVRLARLSLFRHHPFRLQPLSLSSLNALCRDDIDRDSLVQGLCTAVAQTDANHRKAGYEYLISRILESGGQLQRGDEWCERAFDSIRASVARGISRYTPTTLDSHWQVRSDEVVWTVVPARLDFAGGWSDTPPVCFEWGGTVLNAAVKLNGQYPIQVIGRRIEEPVVRINSIDRGVTVTISDFDTLFDFEDPSDWLSLPKSAFQAAGIFPETLSMSFQSAFETLGGGIDLTLFSALPGGSGLGSSSILGIGVIATLMRLLGKQPALDELFAKTSYMEQLMTTGGGWQDQIGGAAGGVKLIQTQPGVEQNPSLSWTHLNDPQMPVAERFLLYYTGYRRMAKNILQKVVGRYLERDDEAIRCVTELKTLAMEMKEDLDRRRVDDFGRKIARAWELNKTLDSGSTTLDIDRLMQRLQPHMLGAKLLGAGGGGFLFIVSKDADATARIRADLSDSPPNDRARFFDFEVDPVGLRVSVL